MRKRYLLINGVIVAGLLLVLWSQKGNGFVLERAENKMTNNRSVGEVEVVLSLPENNWPEGITIDLQGNIYVGNRRLDGQVRVPEIMKIIPDGTVSLFASLPVTANANEESLLGLAADATGNIYAALHSFDKSVNGVWKITPGGNIQHLAGSEDIILPNALIFDPKGNLYVTDSIAGSVWRFDKNGNGSLWVQHVLLEPWGDSRFGFPLPGANGIVFYPPNLLYVANTEKGMVVQIGIRNDGSPGNVLEVIQDDVILTIDGIAVDAMGDVYGVIPGYLLFNSNPLVKIDPRTKVITQLVPDSEIEMFDVPLSLAFGRGARNSKSVYITNGDLPIIPGGPGAGVIEVGVGSPGYPTK
jgi:hypothetical protein